MKVTVNREDFFKSPVSECKYSPRIEFSFFQRRIAFESNPTLFFVSAVVLRGWQGKHRPALSPGAEAE